MSDLKIILVVVIEFTLILLVFKLLEEKFEEIKLTDVIFVIFAFEELIFVAIEFEELILVVLIFDELIFEELILITLILLRILLPVTQIEPEVKRFVEIEFDMIELIDELVNLRVLPEILVKTRELIVSI